MVKNRYRGDLEKANRLYAARKRAGFRSGRAAAVKFGFSESLLRLHETGEIAISRKETDRYAEAFGVSPMWLDLGQGKGPEIDVSRSKRLAMRADTTHHREAPLTQTPAARLRLARRLAGYKSVSEAAETNGWTRSRLSAHENAQNALSRNHAHEYGKAFNVEPTWLLTGEGPSGYPSNIHGALDKLLAMYALNEGDVRSRLPNYQAQRNFERPISFEAFKPRRVTLPALEVLGKYVLLNEYHAVDIVRAVRHGEPLPKSNNAWPFPRGYIEGVLHAAARNCLIVPITRPYDYLRFSSGDRIIVDSSCREQGAEGTFAVALDDEFHVIPGAETRKCEAHRICILGRVIGRIGHL